MRLVLALSVFFKLWILALDEPWNKFLELGKGSGMKKKKKTKKQNRKDRCALHVSRMSCENRVYVCV